MVNHKGIREIATGSLWMFLGISLGHIFQYGNRIIIGRFFGVSDYGLISLSLSITIICSSLSLLGFQFGAARYIAIHENKQKGEGIVSIVINGLKIVLPISVLVVIILLLNKKFLISYIVKEESNFPVLLPFILLIPIIVTAEYFHSCLRGLKKAKFAVISKRVVQRIIVLLILIFLFIFKFKHLLLVSIAYVAGYMGYMLVSGLWLKKSVSFNKKNAVQFDIKEFLLFSLPLMFSFVLKGIGDQVSNVFVGFFKDTKEVGLLGAALSFSRLIVFPLTAVLFIFFPVASEYWHKKRHNELKIVFNTICNWLFVVSGFVFFVFLIFSEEIIVISFGIDFRPAHKALIILSIGQLFYAICGPTATLLLAAGASKKHFIGDFLSLSISVILYFLVVPTYGFLGAAYVNMAYFFVLIIIYLFFAYKITGLLPFNKNIISGLFMLIGAVFILNYIFSQTELVLRIVITLFVYPCIIFVAGLIKKDSFILLYNLLKKEIFKGNS